MAFAVMRGSCEGRVEFKQRVPSPDRASIRSAAVIIYYWSIATTDTPVYHWQQRCPLGEQILPENRDDGPVPLKGRWECRECPKVEGGGLLRSVGTTEHPTPTP